MTSRLLIPYNWLILWESVLAFGHLPDGKGQVASQ